MSWKPITRARSAKSGIWRALSKKNVRITFCPDAWEALRLKPGARIIVEIGEDDHLGRIRLRVGEGGMTVRKQASNLAIAFRKWDAVMDDACAAVSMPFKVIDDGVIEAPLPYWGQAHKLKARKTA